MKKLAQAVLLAVFRAFMCFAAGSGMYSREGLALMLPGTPPAFLP